jgi:hypothetical protein
MIARILPPRSIKGSFGAERIGPKEAAKAIILGRIGIARSNP